MNSDSSPAEKILSTNNPTSSEMEYVRLQQLYPWSALMQFYLLKFYRNTDADKFNAQAKKAALFFPDINNLKWQLFNTSNNHKETVEEKPTSPETTEPIISTTEIIGEELPVAINEDITEEAKPSVTEVIKSEESATSLQPLITEETVVPPVPDVQLPISGVKDPAPNISEEESLIFEPLHTVDYFLSQGIKITEEPISNDKLGLQMKSFTEWLKSMKKIHTEKLSMPDEATDKKIQRIAENSNTSEDVVTEAMAQVLIKQGRKDKAIELYEKLSLLNPLKSAYFAAKIESLKTV